MTYGADEIQMDGFTSLASEQTESGGHKATVKVLLSSRGTSLPAELKPA